MDTVYRIFMFVFPYALCIAGNIWVGRKAWQATHAVWKWVALFFVVCSSVYTVYDVVKRAPKLFTDDNFIYIVIIVNVVLWAVAAISIAIGEPETNKSAS